jgi:hypothetical protein|tara:strand:- start:5236 stop:5643 length:408 start_codon:yes stop_codon:yes gene_type:complete
MGEVIKLRAPQAPAFTDITEMLNQWWKDQEKKPLAKPVKIRHVVEMAHSHGWTLEECYDALNLTWGFSEAAFETALRRIKEEHEEMQRQVTNIASISATTKALKLAKKESLSIKENAQRMRELKEQHKTQGKPVN